LTRLLGQRQCTVHSAHHNNNPDTHNDKTKLIRICRAGYLTPRSFSLVLAQECCDVVNALGLSACKINIMSEAALILITILWSRPAHNRMCCEMALPTLKVRSMRDHQNTYRLPNGRPDMSNEHLLADKDKHSLSVLFLGGSSTPVTRTFKFAMLRCLKFCCYFTFPPKGKISDTT
jgi:hypothetical protein